MQNDPASSLAMSIIKVFAVVALLSVVVGGLPLAITVIRRAFTVDRRSLGYLLVPAISFIILVLYLGFVFLDATRRIQIAGVVQVVQPGNFPVGNRLLLGGVMLLFVFGAIASTVAIWKIVSRTDVEQATFKTGQSARNVNIYKFAYIPAIVVTTSMLVMSIATIIWSKLVFTALPQVFGGNYGLWQTSTQAWVYGIIIVMVICSLAALFGIARGRSALAVA
jgi:hypothetical protein